MATQFKDIYCQSRILERDNWFDNLPTPISYSLCWRYLQYAISIFQYDCNPPSKILTYTPFQEQDYQFVGDGTEVEFLLTPLPLENGQIWVGVRNRDNGKYIALTEGKDYNYNNVTNVITFNSPPVDLSDIWVASYIIGSFTNDLDLREQNILAEGMAIPYLENLKNNGTAGVTYVYGGSTKMFSAANLIKANMENVDNQRKYVQELILEYSYKNYGYDGNGYKGLGGRGGR